MKAKDFAKLTALVILILGFAYLFIFGAKFGDYEVVSVKESIRLGLDLRGGVTVQLQAIEDANDPVTEEKIARAIAIIRNRIDGLGVAEPTITSEGTNRIRIELPEIQDPQRALDLIGQTAQLEFKDEAGNIILTGADIKKAEQQVQASQDLMKGEEYVVAFELTSEGSTKFAEATAANIGKTITINLDGKQISAPTVQTAITGGQGVITGQSTREEASDLASLIMGGSLPVALETLQVSAVGPQLGANAFESSLKAGMIGILLVIAFMVIMYRLPGLISSITLILYITIVLLALALLNATLTLPGIAGFVLTIGMAVDANVIIFERIKEEAKNGKTLKSATEAGFSRAFVTIFDSNITTLIASGILFYFGSGPIKGFAVTLAVGIMASMFTAVVVTKYLLRLLVSSGLIKNSKLFGI